MADVIRIKYSNIGTIGVSVGLLNYKLDQYFFSISGFPLVHLHNTLLYKDGINVI